MSKDNIKVVSPKNNTEFEIDFSDLVSLIKGSSIKSMAISQDFFELGLSDAFNLRMQGKPEILLISTLNDDELPPLKFKIVMEGEPPASAQDIEKRIHFLRQLYATAFMIEHDRSDEVVRILGVNPQADLEDELKNEDKLFITAAGEGSFWITVVPKSVAAFKSLTDIIAIFYDEGRQALLERVRATTDLKKAQVQHEQIKVATELVSLVQKVEKIKDKAVQNKMQETLSGYLTAMGKQPLSLPKHSPQNQITKPKK